MHESTTSAPEPAAPASPDAPSARPPRLPWLEVYVDVPNVELALRDLGLPDRVNYGRLGRELATVLPGGPFMLKRVRCFASVRQFDPKTGIGTLANDHFVSHLRAIQNSSAGTELVLSHRMPPRGAGGRWEEKGVDVNLASSMMEAACDGKFDTAVLVANDSDYAGLARRVRARQERRVGPPSDAALGQRPPVPRGDVLLPPRPRSDQAVRLAMSVRG